MTPPNTQYPIPNTVKSNIPVLGIFDLTDCEGCELQILNLKEKLLKLAEIVDVANWRLAKSSEYFGPFDISLVEGTPITEEDIKIAKKIRENSKVVVALGACAHLGGVPAELDEASREKYLKQVYGENYKSNSKAAKPLSAHIYVDYFIHGCPIDLDEAERILVSIIMGKNPMPVAFPVCLECKERENPCLFLKGEPCQGPITQGGCKAICPSFGLRCWGCQGAVKDANFTAMENNLKRIGYEDLTENIIGGFNNQEEQYKTFRTKKHK